MSTQLVALQQLVREKRDTHADPVERVLEWLVQVSTFLDGEPSLEPETIALVIKQARPEWGVRTVEEGQAYLRFWERLAKRHPYPAIRGAYAVQLCERAPARAHESLEIFADVIKEMPSLFVELADAFSTIAEQAGKNGRRTFELAKIRFYVDLVNRNEMDPVDLEEAIAELMSEFNDSSLRSELWSIAHSFMRA